MFIPLTLDNSTKSAFGGAQFVSISAAVVVAVLLQVGLLTFYADNHGFNFFANGFILVAFDIAALYFILWILRKFVFKEDQLLRAYEATKTNEVSDLSLMWDIFNIENNRICFVNGYVATVVRLQHGYVYDRPERHTEMHRECIKNAIAFLNRKGYWFRYYNREVKETNLEPLYKTERLLEQDKGTDFYNLETDIINHVKKLCTSIASTELELYMIIAPDIYTIQDIDIATEEFMSHLKGSLFTFSKRLDTDELYKFMCDYYDLQSIDVDKILKQKYRDTTINVVNVVDVVMEEPVESDVEEQSEEVDEVFLEYQRMLEESQNKQEDDIYL